jgi:hypothetical protein
MLLSDGQHYFPAVVDNDDALGIQIYSLVRIAAFKLIMCVL